MKIAALIGTGSLLLMLGVAGPAFAQDKPEEKPQEQKAPEEKPAEKPAAKPAAKPATKPASKPASKPVDQPGAKPKEYPKTAHDTTHDTTHDAAHPAAAGTCQRSGSSGGQACYHQERAGPERSDAHCGTAKPRRRGTDPGRQISGAFRTRASLPCGTSAGGWRSFTVCVRRIQFLLLAAVAGWLGI